MKTLKYVTLLVVGLMIGLSSAFAQAIPVYTGGKGNTYWNLVDQGLAFCKGRGMLAHNFVTAASSGSEFNIDAVERNQGFALVQLDALAALEKSPEKIKVLKVMHPEAVHLVASANPRKVGGKLGFGAKPLDISTSASVDGTWRIGAAGGSIITAGIINKRLGWNTTIVEMESTSAALQALHKGQLDLVFVVGGAPLGLIDQLSHQQFRLMALADEHVATLKATGYGADKVTYLNLQQRNVQVVSVPALLITSNYTQGKGVTMASELRRCFDLAATELGSTPGSAPQWASVGKISSSWATWEGPASKK